MSGQKVYNLQDRFAACIIAGAIGDAWGSSYENSAPAYDKNTFFYGRPKPVIRQWQITDDTQLTLVTCEALCDEQAFSPGLLAQYFVRYYKQNKITGTGASTLKALRELELGAHWNSTGRTGEYAAGNGAAMRIAPLAFFKNLDRETVRTVCNITHKNDEAYTGALAIFLIIRFIINNEWKDESSLLTKLIAELPDTRVRDRLIAIHADKDSLTIADISKWGNSGYVVDSVPFAIFSAMHASKIGMKEMYRQIIETGGDTDTNASIAGQIAGTLLGPDAIDDSLVVQLKELEEYEWIMTIITKAKIKIG